MTFIDDFWNHWVSTGPPQWRRPLLLCLKTLCFGPFTSGGASCLAARHISSPLKPPWAFARTLSHSSSQPLLILFTHTASVAAQLALCRTISEAATFCICCLVSNLGASYSAGCAAPRTRACENLQKVQGGFLITAGWRGIWTNDNRPLSLPCYGQKKGRRESYVTNKFVLLTSRVRSHRAFIIQTLYVLDARFYRKSNVHPVMKKILLRSFGETARTEQKIQIFLQMLWNYGALSGAKSRRILT